jgi:anti-anti-sigma factor
MSISSSLSADEQELRISIEGRFDFSSHSEFRKAYEDLEARVGSYIVDMSGASYLDSSALGMLLLLRDYAGGDNANICIADCNDDIKKILAISNFEQLFTIK